LETAELARQPGFGICGERIARPRTKAEAVESDCDIYWHILRRKLLQPG
jgi:hypothetical protein